MPAHRKATIRSMMTVLFKHERITTTRAKAKEVQRFAEKEITRAKVDSVHNRRMVGRKIYYEAILAKLFTDIAPRFKERNGGYTRVLHLGERKLDAADMVVLELVERKEDDKKKAEREKRKAQKAEKKAKEKVAEEAQAK
jgi:large subunit ribosomal protein L17